MVKTTAIDTPLSLSLTKVTSQSMIPRLVKSPESAVNPPIVNMEVQPLKLSRASFHVTVLEIISAEQPRRATAVASTPVQIEVDHRTMQPMKTASSHFSPVLVGPISFSISAASLGASGVLVTVGFIILYMINGTVNTSTRPGMTHIMAHCGHEICIPVTSSTMEMPRGLMAEEVKNIAATMFVI